MKKDNNIQCDGIHAHTHTHTSPQPLSICSSVERWTVKDLKTWKLGWHCGSVAERLPGMGKSLASIPACQKETWKPSNLSLKLMPLCQKSRLSNHTELLKSKSYWQSKKVINKANKQTKKPWRSTRPSISKQRTVQNPAGASLSMGQFLTSNIKNGSS